MKKLALSKAIMDKHNDITRNGTKSDTSKPVLEEFNTPNVKYNLPSDVNLQSEGASNINRQNDDEFNSKDRILNSKLPEDIKRVMMENPIVIPSQMQHKSVLTEEMIDKASKLMGNQPKKETTPQVKQNTSDLKKMLKDSILEVLKETGLIPESTQKASEMITFRIGEHIFEGKITKVKKVKTSR